MNTQITPEDIKNALTDYNAEDCSETFLLDYDVFQELAVLAHDQDITVNALVNALIRISVEETELPSIPGVGTAPYMTD